MSHRFIFLSEEFYRDYPQEQYVELEVKRDRPYIHLCVMINGIWFAVPLRSHISHRYALWTDRVNRCGADLTKAVVISKAEYIDTLRKPHIRQAEYKELLGKEHLLAKKMEDYVSKYKRARQRGNPRDALLCRYSTLQYFEEFIM